MTNDILALVFGCISIFMSLAIEVPQLYAIFKTRNTSGTSLAAYIIFLVSSMIWIVWAVSFYLANMYGTPSTEQPSLLHLAGFVPAILSNTTNVVLVSAILIIKIKHLLICKRRHITELELSKELFDNQKKDSWIRKFYLFLIICFIDVVICVSICLILQFTWQPFEYSEEQHKLFNRYVMVFNIIASITFEAVSWPQFIKCMKHKDTSGISLGWAIFLPLSCYVCFSYNLLLGLTSHDIFSVLSSLICSGAIINTMVLILKIKNILAAKKLGLSEWTYTKRYIDTKRKSK